MNYIVNETVIGYETIDIDTLQNMQISKEDTVTVVLNDKTQEGSCLPQYYKCIKHLLKNNIPAYIIMDADKQKIRGSICNLMALYGNYNVYKVPDKNCIDQSFLKELVNRTATYDEMATYLQNDIVAYDDLDVVLQGVQECVSRNDLERLKTLIEGHLPTIEAAPNVLSTMKVQIDTSNQALLQDKIAQVKQQLQDANNKIDKKQSEIKEQQSKIDDLQEQLKDANRQLTQNKADMEELRLQANNSGPTLRSYSPIKTSLLKCKTENIIYIKEISQIPYINSFVVMLMEMIKQFRRTCKLLVYDNTSATSITYGNMQKVDAAEFESNKQVLIDKTPKFVVAEPAPQILKDILQNMNPQFDVVIIYDKMKQAADLVEGNNVYKFWVINSFNDYNQTKNLFKIDNTDRIITRPQSRIGADVIDIPRIKAYEQEPSDNGKFQKYKGVQTTITKKPLMMHFMSMCNIQRKTT